jgi:hypothetical protein
VGTRLIEVHDDIRSDRYGDYDAADDRGNQQATC